MTLTSTSKISVNCKKASQMHQPWYIIKSAPKQGELNVAIGIEKDIFLLLHKKCDHGLLTQEDRKELKSYEKNSWARKNTKINKQIATENDRNCLEIIANLKQDHYMTKL